tara:strand:- start:557 stop:799 length:243 start_codon:yes stop_codon:yes gene_type:complete
MWLRSEERQIHRAKLNYTLPPPTTYPACVGLCQTGRWGAVKECWSDGKSRDMRWFYYPFAMRFFNWDRNGAYLGRRRKIK